MTTVKDVYDLLDRHAPFKNQESYDNSGLIYGEPEREVKRICVAIDCTNEVIAEAEAENADLILTHHPAVFHALKRFRDDMPICGLIKRNIALISSHISYDVASRSVTDLMLELLGFNGEKEILEPLGDDYGVGRIVTLDFGADAKTLAMMCKKAFYCSCVKYIETDRPIHRVALCSGSGNDDIAIAKEKGCDCLITGELKWSSAVEAKNVGLAIVEAGHFHTENIFCSEILKLLSTELPSVESFMAKSSRDLYEYL